MIKGAWVKTLGKRRKIQLLFSFFLTSKGCVYVCKWACVSLCVGHDDEKNAETTSVHYVSGA